MVKEPPCDILSAQMTEIHSCVKDIDKKLDRVVILSAVNSAKIENHEKAIAGLSKTLIGAVVSILLLIVNILFGGR